MKEEMEFDPATAKSQETLLTPRCKFFYFYMTKNVLNMKSSEFNKRCRIFRMTDFSKFGTLLRETFSKIFASNRGCFTRTT